MAPNNPLSSWGNDKTMNLNTLLLTNIQSSPYFKVQLFELKTFHEVVDEIYYKVDHLEPWEKGSRKTAGQTGMCGGVRGVGAGGIVSSAYCLLFKLFTLKLTKKQLNNLITHCDSPYIRGIGFMYIRYCQQPSDLWDWFEPYLDDEEELDVKAGGGHTITIGEMLRQWLVKLEWYSTLFPRIPVPIQKDLDVKLRSRPSSFGYSGYGQQQPPQREQRDTQREPQRIPDDEVSFGEAERVSQSQRNNHGRGRDNYSNGSSYSRRSPPARRRTPPRRSPNSRDDFSRELEREKDRQRRERDPEFKRDDKRRSRSRSRSKDRKRQQTREDSRERYREDRDRYREDRDRDSYKEKDRDGYREKDQDYKRERDQDYKRGKDQDYKREKAHKKHKKSHKHNKDRDSSRERHRDREGSREKHRDRKYS